MVLSIFFTSLMGFQLIRSMEIDAYELTQTRVDLFGYWLGFLLASILWLWLVKKGRAMLSSFTLVILLLTYLTGVHLFTAHSDSLISFMISRYGLLMWFVLGLGFSAVLGVLHERKDRSTTKPAIFMVMSVIALYALLFAVRIIQSPVDTSSYQAVASSATVILIMFTCIFSVVWDRRLPMILVFVFISFTSILVAAVVLLQSTGMFLIWLGITISLIGQKIRDSRRHDKFAMVIVLSILLCIFFESAIFDIIKTSTRFAVFFERGGGFTPLTSRLEILGTFFQQFEVSPIFGHFKAHIVAGFDEGVYIHSLPLSFLTHAGLVGTSLVFVILFNLLYGRNPWRSGLEPSEHRLVFLMLTVLGLGSISSFLTWSVFWFMLGVLCRRPAKIMMKG